MAFALLRKKKKKKKVREGEGRGEKGKQRREDLQFVTKERVGEK